MSAKKTALLLAVAYTVYCLLVVFVREPRVDNRVYPVNPRDDYGLFNGHETR